MTLRWIKVFGERNTGTRAVQRMIDGAPLLAEAGLDLMPDEDLMQYDVMIDQVSSIYSGPWKRVYREAIKDLRTRELGPLGQWKHAAPVYHPAFRAEDVAVLFLVRNPYSWVMSLAQRPYHCMGRRQQSLDDFLVFPWLCLGRDNVEPVLSSPMYLWSLKLAAYRRFRMRAAEEGVATAVMRFEDFVQNPVMALTRSLTSMDVGPGGLSVFAEDTKPSRDYAGGRQAYYLNETWREELTATSVGLINDMTDWEMAEDHGYTRLDPADFPDEIGTEERLDRKRRAASAA